MRRSYGIIILLATIGASIIPVVVYRRHFDASTFSGTQADWGTFGDFLGGLLNPFISFLTLIVTIYIAYSLNEYEKRKNTENKRQDDVKSYLELYQYFVGAEFREKRQIAWSVLRRAVEYPEYAAFIVKENFVCRYSDRTPRQEIFENFHEKLYPKESYKRSDFLHKESEDRHKLDAVVNFFQLLAVKDVPNDNYAICDFYYDSWRPLLCWYAQQLEKGYNLYEENKMFNNPPNLRTAIALLDKKYYKPTTADTLTVDTIAEHPILKWYFKKECDD